MTAPKILSTGIKSGVQAITNPTAIVRAAPLTVKSLAPKAVNFGKTLVKGIVGGETVNAISKATTGKTWGEHVASSLGVSPELGEFINPGFGLGPLIIKSPKTYFDNLPYKTIYNILDNLSRFKDNAIVFFNTPLNKNPIKAIRDRNKALQAGRSPRTDIGLYDNNIYYNKHGSLLTSFDPISLIRKRLRSRMTRKDYSYSYPNDGIGIYLDNNMYNSDYIISQIPVKDYLSLKEVYKLGLNNSSRLIDKLGNGFIAPFRYLNLNTQPGFAYFGDGNRFIKVNRKALKDMEYDYSTALSHEYNHALRNYNLKSMDLKFLKELGFNYDHLVSEYKNYLSTPTEIEARGTQLKNYFDSDVITPDMLKFASQHYVPGTGMDNNMYLFFSGIKDWNIAADYLTKYSLKNGGKLV